MKKKLSAIGDSLGIVIENPILEALDIDRETELDVTTDGRRIIVEPVRRRRKRVLASAKRVMDAHGETFRKLAERARPDFATWRMSCRSMRRGSPRTRAAPVSAIPAPLDSAVAFDYRASQSSTTNCEIDPSSGAASFVTSVAPWSNAVHAIRRSKSPFAMSRAASADHAITFDDWASDGQTGNCASSACTRATFSWTRVDRCAPNRKLGDDQDGTPKLVGRDTGQPLRDLTPLREHRDGDVRVDDVFHRSSATGRELRCRTS